MKTIGTMATAAILLALAGPASAQDGGSSSCSSQAQTSNGEVQETVSVVSQQSDGGSATCSSTVESSSTVVDGGGEVVVAPAVIPEPIPPSGVPTGPPEGVPTAQQILELVGSGVAAPRSVGPALARRTVRNALRGLVHDPKARCRRTGRLRYRCAVSWAGGHGTMTVRFARRGDRLRYAGTLRPG